MSNFKSDLTTHLQSALQTFVAGFLGFIVLQLGSPIQWDKTFLLALGSAALRAGVKAMFENFAPKALGGKESY